MIWFRRVAAVPLLFFALVLFMAALIATSVNSTLGNPGFYNDQMVKADMYNFIYDGLLPAVVDEIEDPSDSPISVETIKSEIVPTAKKILPPDWLQARFESGTEAFVPYFVGSTDTFTYTLELKDRVKEGTRVFRDDILQGETFNQIYDDLVKFATQKVNENLDAFPFPVSLTQSQIENELRTVVSREWVRAQIAGAIDALTPYLVNDAAHFTVKVQLRDRVDPAAAAMVDLLGGPETYDYLTDQIIVPMVSAVIQANIVLPYTIRLSQSEIAEAIKQTLPQSWVQARFREVIDNAAAYVKGETNSFVVAVPLSDRKAAALDVISTLAEKKLETAFNGLSQVSTPEFLQAFLAAPSGTLPSVRPAGLTYVQLKDLLRTTVGVDIAGIIRAELTRSVINQIPDRWDFTQQDMIDALGAGNADLLDKTRGWVINGYTFTDVDLKDKLSPDSRETLDDVREKIGSGLTITEADLNEQISDDEQGAPELDDARHAIGNVRTWAWALWLLPLGLFFCSGLLIGRTWKTKLLWFTGALFVVGLIALISFGAVLPGSADAMIDEEMSTVEAESAVEAVAIAKVAEVAHNVVGAFSSGLVKMATFTMVGAAIGMAGVIVWSRRGPAGKPGSEPDRKVAGQSPPDRR